MHRLFLFLSLFTSFLFVHAQKFNFNRISVEEGLAQPSLYALAEDEKGRLWIGLENGGIQIYDGYSIHSLKLNVQYGKDIRSIYKSSADAMWIGANSEGVTVVQKDSVYQFNESNGLKSNYIRAFAEDYDGRMWVGTLGGGVVVIDEGEVIKNIGVKEGLLNLNVKSLMHSKRGEMWVGTSTGLFVFRDFKLYKVYTGKNGLKGGDVLAIKEDHEGVVWVGTDKGLFTIKNSTIYNNFSEQTVKSCRVKSILIDRENSVWIGTKTGVGKITGYTISQKECEAEWFSRENGLSNNRVRCMLQDQSGALWIGTYFGGINRFFNEAFSLLNHSNGLSDDIISCVSEKSLDTSLWIGTYGAGVNVLKNGRVEVINTSRGLSDDNISCILHLPNDLTFVGTNEGISVVKGNEIEVIDSYSGEFKGNQILGIVGDSAIIIALTHEHELVVLNLNKGVEVDSVLTRNLQNYVLDKVYKVVYNRGVFYLLSDKHVKAISFNKGLLKLGQVWNVDFSQNLLASGERLIGYNRNNHFFYLDEDRVEFIDSMDPTKSIKFFVRQNEDVYWMGVDQRIERITVLNGKFKSIKSFDYNEGFIGLQAYENAALIDLQGDLVVGTIKGVFKAKQNCFRGTKRDLMVYLNKVEYGSEGASLNLEEYCKTMNDGVPEGLVLPYNRNELKFEVRSFHLKNPAEIRYKFVLSGDENVVREGVSNKEYFHLKAGDYVLQVFAKTQWGDWSSNPLEIKFSVTTVFWKRPSFYVSGSLLIIAAFFLFLYSRSKKLERDKMKLEGLIEERTQDLQEEQEKSETLLLNILPLEIATELKVFGEARTKKYQEASVLFTDFKGFTSMSSDMDPVDLVACLDEIFKGFDEIIERNQLEKIKTIGDAYMCASGIPEPSRFHAINIVLAGLQIIEFMNLFNKKQLKEGKPVWEIRVGIHSGELIAGVVGKKKFAYDIWGDTVNVASRMESNGVPGRLNTSKSTYQLIKEFFETEKRGEIAVKNRGQLEMFFVNRLNQKYSKDANGVEPKQELFSQ